MPPRALSFLLCWRLALCRRRLASITERIFTETHPTPELLWQLGKPTDRPTRPFPTMIFSLPPLNELCTYPTLFSAGTAACNGRGHCDSVSMRCICDAPWSATSDWINLDGRGCEVNTLGLRVAWAAVLLLLVKNLVAAVKVRSARELSISKHCEANNRRRHTQRVCLTPDCPTLA